MGKKVMPPPPDRPEEAALMQSLAAARTRALALGTFALGTLAVRTLALALALGLLGFWRAWRTASTIDEADFSCF